MSYNESGMKALRSNGYRPAKGLLRLTWAQVQEIDALVSSLCALTEHDGSEAEMTLVVKAGKLRFARRPVLSQELKPARE